MIVEKNMKIEKDAQEVGKLLVDLIDAIVNKKDYNLVIADLIPAIDSIATVPASWEQNKGLVLGSILFELGNIANILDKK